jgi:uncharacterized phiE125 gp8 family phage protein
MPAAAVAQAAAAVGEHMRGAGGDADGTVARAAAAALALGEAFTGTLFLERACEDVLAARAHWQPLDALPVTAITGAVALPAGAGPRVLAADAFAIDIDPDATGWVRVTDAGSAERVAVAYRAGLAGDWAGLPPALSQGVVALAAHLLAEGAQGTAPPASVAALWRPWRRLRLQAAAERRA